MVHGDQWIVPVLDDQPYLDKPPLLYWLVMTSYSCFGPKLWAARAVALLAAVLLVLVTYWWGRRIGGPGVATSSAIVLLLTPSFQLYGPMLTMNGLLGLCVTGALACGHIALC